MGVACALVGVFLSYDSLMLRECVFFGEDEYDDDDDVDGGGGVSTPPSFCACATLVARSVEKKRH